MINKIPINVPTRTLKAGWTVTETDFSTVIPPAPLFKLVESYETDYRPPEGQCVIDARYMVSEWIEKQSSDQWRRVMRDSRATWDHYRYIVSEELMTLLVLTWS